MRIWSPGAIEAVMAVVKVILTSPGAGMAKVLDVEAANATGAVGGLKGVSCAMSGPL